MSFAIATGIIFVSRSVILVLMATGVTGFLLTAIQVLPYALISQYHKDATVSLKALNLTLKFELEILTLKFDLEILFRRISIRVESKNPSGVKDYVKYMHCWTRRTFSLISSQSQLFRPLFR